MISLAACTTSPVTDAGPSDAGLADAPPDAPHPMLAITSVDTHFSTRDHMVASFEMQQSGEPLAQAMGRSLGGFDRNRIPPNMYTDPDGLPDGGMAAPVLDLVGFATAIESYEYSKQPMNNLALESGAGVSLLFGPVFDPTAAGGMAALTQMRTSTLAWAIESRLAVHAMTTMGTPIFPVPIPTSDPTNVLGWRGLWPTMLPFEGFDPTIAATSGLGHCSITPGDGDDGRGGTPANPVGDYECDYNTLNVPRSAMQTVVGPGAAGWAAWKYALWITNYLQIMHDTAGNPIASVPAGMGPMVGTEGNTIVGQQSSIGGDPTMMGCTTTSTGAPCGTYLGSSDIEGFQASVMLDELDNAALAWLTQLNTTDGTHLGGFATLSDALAYDYTQPLRWIPADIAVTESMDASGFPRPTYSVMTSDSRLFDLLGLAGAYAQLYGITDEHNTSTGGQPPAMVYFDGDPFPHDDQTANAESTIHDRSITLLKFLTISIDRMHVDPTSGLLVDTVTFGGGTPTRGTTIDTTSVAYAMVSLRAVRNTLGSHLTLYGLTTPDTAVSSTPLDSTGFAGAPGGANIAGRLTTLLHAHADLLLNHLTDANGNAYPGWDVSTSMPTSTTGTLDSHAAAIDGLLDAYLATGDTHYRDRALAVFAHMESTFWDDTLRMYRSGAAADAAIEFTPLRYAIVSRALRNTYELIGMMPGNDMLAATLQSRIARLVKLVLNGWDDVNDDGVVNWPSECVRVEGGLPRGGLQMAERALTGELGMAGGTSTSDRDHDCVPEIDDAMLPSALAARVTFARAP